MYTLKLFHISCVVISISGFFLRGLLLFTRPELLAPRWIRIAPHIVDSLLFFSGIALAVGFGYLPWEHDWLLAKMLLLLLYIVLGHIVLGRCWQFAQGLRFGCWMLALATAGYMAYLARYKQFLLL